MNKASSPYQGRTISSASSRCYSQSDHSSVLLSPPLLPVDDHDAPYKPRSSDTTSLRQRSHRHKGRKNMTASRNGTTPTPFNMIVGTDRPKPPKKPSISLESEGWGLVGQAATLEPTDLTVEARMEPRRLSVTIASHTNLPRNARSFVSWKYGSKTKRRPEPGPPTRDTPASITLRKASLFYACEDLENGSGARKTSRDYEYDAPWRKEYGVVFSSHVTSTLDDRVRSGSYRPTSWQTSFADLGEVGRSSMSEGHGATAAPALTLANIHALTAISPPRSRQASRVGRDVSRLNSVIQINTGVSHQEVIWSQDDPPSSPSDCADSPPKTPGGDKRASVVSICSPVPQTMNSIAEHLEQLLQAPETDETTNKNHMSHDSMMHVWTWDGPLSMVAMAGAGEVTAAMTAA
jgi:hypothetical protein